MNYDELIRNIGKAGLSVKEFAILLKANPNSITNIKKKESVPKNLGIIAVLLGEMVDKGLDYKHLFEKLNLHEQKRRRSEEDREILFKKKNEE
ncbi:XRE family transcriptional regulator [Aliarcobacter cryaerophilus]|uniref:XRE family transcriptional regulator n=1 Tax=Aliarcobacter cryaerophilus TaxID=28198 RepID=UPI00112F4F28|nr:XRE family transcriptional regulator [Aliarcobacter cryaerophilus]